MEGLIGDQFVPESTTLLIKIGNCPSVVDADTELSVALFRKSFPSESKYDEHRGAEIDQFPVHSQLLYASTARRVKNALLRERSPKVSQPSSSPMQASSPRSYIYQGRSRTVQLLATPVDLSDQTI